MQYRVLVIRSGEWWAIEFPDVDDRIHSQARRLEQVPSAAAEAISLSLDVSVSPEDIELELVLGDELDEVIQRARDERARAESAARSARETTVRAAVVAHREFGLSVRDVGELLEVSHQYAARLVKS